MKKLLLIIVVLAGLSNSNNEIQKIKIGTKSTVYTFEDSNIFEIRTNLKKINILISQMNNINLLQITDLSSETKLIEECNRNSRLCQIRQTNENSTITYESSMCVSSIFLLFQKKNSGNSSFSISVESNYDEEHCELNNENLLSYCGQVSVDDCSKCLRPSCELVQCGSRTNTTFNLLYNICLPISISDKEREKRCKNFNNANTFQLLPENKCGVPKVKKFSGFTLFLISIIIIFVFVFILAFGYYNFYIWKYEEAPFNPPSFFPEFLFPRKEDHRVTMDNLDNIFTQQQLN